MLGCVVLNYNDSDTTAKLISKINCMNLIDIVVVVDNCSTDDSYTKLCQFSSDKIKVVRSSKNGGYGYGNNVGIKYLKENSDVEYILICNPDVNFDENVLKPMLDNFDDDTAIVAPLTLQPDGKKQLPIAWKVPKFSDYFVFSSLILNRLFKPMSYPESLYKENICEVDCVQGSFFMIDSKCIDDKLYDENIFLFFEESCIGKKFKDKGLKTKLLTNVMYVHEHSTSINKSIDSEVKKRKIMLDSFMTYMEDYYQLNKFQILLMKLYKKIISIENTILLKIFFN